LDEIRYSLLASIRIVLKSFKNKNMTGIAVIIKSGPILTVLKNIIRKNIKTIFKNSGIFFQENIKQTAEKITKNNLNKDLKDGDDKMSLSKKGCHSLIKSGGILETITSKISL
jgi:uncharacterized membrane protein YobD (UPF0266 family)